MDEKTFFDHGDVKVTNARFVTGAQTFAMSNITSVKALHQPPKRTAGIVFLLIGIAAVFSQNLVFGFPVVALSAYYLYKQKTTYHVMLTTSGGETSALTTHQQEYLHAIVTALNEAIVSRG